MIVVLGAGPAGLAAAYKLAADRRRPVTIVERQQVVGGNAGSFTIDGVPVDFGSHRLHPATPADVLSDIRRLLGDDLLDRPRHGRIRLRGRWVHFPLRPLDLARHLPPAFAAGVLADIVRKPVTAPRGEPSFATVLEHGLGRTICRDFYFPYAEKIWGLPPSAIDAEQARRRVRSGSIGKMIGRVLGALPGLRRPGAGRFYYPRHGFGQIAGSYAAAARAAGATLLLGSGVTALQVCDGRVTGVEVQAGPTSQVIPSRQVLSTIPIQLLARLVRGHVPPPATAALPQRAIVLVYLTLDAERFTEFDAHYFPEPSIRISRLSEPKNYSLTVRPGRTVVCAELPCSPDSPEWGMSDADLGALVARDLEHAQLGPLPRIAGVQTVRLPQAYPIYVRGYRAAFDDLDSWVSGIDGLVTFGRQGLFVHDNTHHTIAMAYALVRCLRDDDTLDREAWAAARQTFEDHVVED